MNENLNNKEAVNKLIELVKGIHVGIFCTELTKTPIQSRPMSVEDVDDQGNLWFISSATSNKNFEISAFFLFEISFNKNLSQLYEKLR